MLKIYVLLLFFSVLLGANRFIDPDGAGTDSGSGTIDSPWATVKYAFENCTSGDTLYLRAGNHTVYDGGYSGITAGVWTKYNNHDNLVIMPYNDENVTVIDSVKGYLFVMEQDSIRFYNLNFDLQNNGISFGYDLSTTGGIVDNCTFTMAVGGDNVYCVSMGAKAGVGEITNNTLTGPCGSGDCTGIHLNTNGIFCSTADHVSVMNNTISDFPIGIYFKHGNTGGVATTNEIAYNYIYNCSRYSIETNSEYTNFHDNIIGSGNGNFRINESNGVPDGDHNTINHNTINSGQLYLSTDDDGANYNTITNNIIASYTVCCTGNSWDYNIYISGSAIGSNDIANTSPTYDGGANPTTIAGFKLSTGSAGENVANDGKDMGANVSLVGVGASESSIYRKHISQILGFE